MDSEYTVYFPVQMDGLTLEFKLQFQAQKLLALSASSTSSISEENSGESLASVLNLDAGDTLSKNVLLQLKNYFLSATSFHAVSLAPQGTVFQKSVWHELSEIPMGETRTYGEIANKLNSSARAVGNACRRNPIQIIIPCHRVVSAQGLGGYAGQTQGEQLDIKRWLLNHEGVRL